MEDGGREVVRLHRSGVKCPVSAFQKVESGGYRLLLRQPLVGDEESVVDFMTP